MGKKGSRGGKGKKSPPVVLVALPAYRHVLLRQFVLELLRKLVADVKLIPYHADEGEWGTELRSVQSAAKHGMQFQRGFKASHVRGRVAVLMFGSFKWGGQLPAQVAKANGHGRVPFFGVNLHEDAARRTESQSGISLERQVISSEFFRSGSLTAGGTVRITALVREIVDSLR